MSESFDAGAGGVEQTGTESHSDGMPHCCDRTGHERHSSLPFIVGVAGGTASGKTSVCARIMQELEQEQLGVHERRVVTICQDSFYKALNPDEQLLAQEGKYNFDHPDALDADLIVETLKKLIRNQKVKIPVYDFKNNRPDPEKFDEVYPANVIIVEGILIFYFPTLRELFHLKLFVDMDADSRLARRVRRDNLSRGRTLENILRQYTMFVKPAFEDYCLPTKTYADIIIPRGAENDVAIELICQHIKHYLAGSLASNDAVSSSHATKEANFILQQQNGEMQDLSNLSPARRAASHMHHRLTSETLPSSTTTGRRDAELSLERATKFLLPTDAIQRHISTDMSISSADAEQRLPYSGVYGHSAAYRRARSFGNDDLLTKTEDDDDLHVEDQAFESEVVHHRHHQPYSAQVSRLRRSGGGGERERSTSVGNSVGMSKTVSCEFGGSSSSGRFSEGERGGKM